MHSLEDKLSRISALRPASIQPSAIRPGTDPDSGVSAAVRLLDGTLERNSRGSYIRVHRTYSNPVSRSVDGPALDLLQPGFRKAMLDPGKWLFLDTETTGLSGGTGTYAFLVGIGWWEPERFVIEQYFMRDHSEEPAMLYGLLPRLQQRPVLVTYNGKSFDWPLIQTRYRMNRIDAVQEPLEHLDLLYPARRLWRLRLDSVALTQVETHILKFERGSDIPSETIPQIYFNFLRGGSPKGIANVLHHNRMDLCGLAHLAHRVLDIFEDPENSTCCASELYGMSRLLQQRGDAGRAEHLCRLAVEMGLPEAVERLAEKELALAAKRRRDYERSNELWEKLLGDTAEGICAYEQLAIYYEHQARELMRAADLTREALVMLQEARNSGRILSSQYIRLYTGFRHRLDRLKGKIIASSCVQSRS